MSASVTVVTAAVTVTATDTPSVVVVTTTIAPTDLSLFSSLPTPTPAPNGSEGATASPFSSSPLATAPASPSTAVPSPTTSSSSSSSNRSLVAAVAGGLIGGFAFFTLLFVMGCLTWRRSKKKAGAGGRKQKGGLISADAALDEKPRANGLPAGVRPSSSQGSASFLPSRPVLYARQGPQSSSQGSGHMPLMAGAAGFSRGLAGASSSSSPLDFDKRGYYTPVSSTHGSAPLYGVHSTGAPSSSYDFFDVYTSDASTPASGDTKLALRHSQLPSTDSMARQPSEGVTSVASSATAPSAIVPPTQARPKSAGSRDGPAHPPQRPESFKETGAQGPPARQDRPLSAGSAATVLPQASPGSDKPSYTTSAAAYAIPMLAESRASTPSQSGQHTQHRGNAPNRPPAAGMPFRHSTLSTIQGSISERTPTERSDSIRESSTSQSTVQHTGASSVPRLPSIPASSPLIVQGSVTEAKSDNELYPGNPQPATGTHASSTSSRDAGTGTIDSTGTFNTFTGQRKSELHIVGTYSSQGSSLPPIDSQPEAVDGSLDDRSQPNAKGGHDTMQGKRMSDLDPQDHEFWIVRGNRDSNDEKVSSQGKTRSRQATAEGAQLPVVQEDPSVLSERVSTVKEQEPQLNQQRSSSCFTPNPVHGSRLIEVFEGSDTSDDGLIPADPFASHSPLQVAAELRPETSASRTKRDSDVDRNSRLGQDRSSSSIVSFLGIAHRDPDDAQQQSAETADLGAGQSRAESRPGSQAAKRTSGSPFDALVLRFGRSSRASERSEGDAGRKGGKNPALTQSADRTPALSLDQLPPLDFGTTSLAQLQTSATSPAAPASTPGSAKRLSMSRTASRDSAQVLAEDFFSAATFSQPLTMASAGAGGGSLPGPGDSSHMDKPTAIPLGSVKERRLSPTKKAGSKGTARSGGKASETDIDQLF